MTPSPGTTVQTYNDAHARPPLALSLGAGAGFGAEGALFHTFLSRSAGDGAGAGAARSGRHERVFGGEIKLGPAHCSGSNADTADACLQTVRPQIRPVGIF